LPKKRKRTNVIPPSGVGKRRRKSYVWGRIPDKVDVDHSCVGKLVFAMVSESTQLRINDVILLVLEYAARVDPLELFLSSGSLLYGPALYALRSEVQNEFRKFCVRYDLRNDEGKRKPSVSLSVTKAKIRKALLSRGINIRHDRRPHPNNPALGATYSTWIVGAKLA